MMRRALREMWYHKWPLLAGGITGLIIHWTILRNIVWPWD